MLACWCITTYGQKVLLHLAVGQQGVGGVLDRVLPGHDRSRVEAPTSVSADGARGLINALGVSSRAPCRSGAGSTAWATSWPRFPEEAKAEFAAYLRAVRDAATPELGRAAATEPDHAVQGPVPGGRGVLHRGPRGLLAHLRLPARHRTHYRTTNLIERSFEEERRRTKVIPRFTDERSAMKLVFAVLIRCSERWSRVSITDIERHQLRLLRAELGIDPPPTPGEKEERSRKRKIA